MRPDGNLRRAALAKQARDLADAVRDAEDDVLPSGLRTTWRQLLRLFSLGIIAGAMPFNLDVKIHAKRVSNG